MAEQSTDECVDELTAADNCVQQNTETCACLQQRGEEFRSSFPDALVSSFQKLLDEQEIQDESSYCKVTEDNICQFIQEKASCCCQEETISYTACVYATKIAINYPTLQNCTRSTTCSLTLQPNESDTIDQQQERQYMMYGIVISIVFFILSVIYYFCCSRKRRKKLTVNRNEKQNEVEINVRCTSEGKVSESHTSKLERKEKRSVSRSHHDHGSSKKKQSSRKKEKKGSKREMPNYYTGEDESAIDWDVYNQTFHTRDHFEIEDIEHGDAGYKFEKSKRSTSKTKTKQEERNAWKEERTARDEIEYNGHRKAPKTKEKRRRTESCDEAEKIKRRSSRSLSSNTSSSSLTRSLRDEKNEDSGRERREKGGRRRESRKRQMKESIRKARSLLDTVDSTVQITVIPCLKEVIELLEEERRKLELRQRAAEEEKLRLLYDLQSSRGYIEELHEKEQQHQAELQKAKLNKELIRRGSTKCLVEYEARQERLNSDLEELTCDKEEMIFLLTQLKQKQRDLGQQLESKVDSAGYLVQYQMELFENGPGAIASISTAEEQKQIMPAHGDVALPEWCVHDSTAHTDLDIETSELYLHHAA